MGSRIGDSKGADVAYSKRIVLHFPEVLVDKPIIYKLVKDLDLVINILRASISPEEVGMIVMELSGKKSNFDKGIAYLENLGVTVQSLAQDVTWSEERCTQCGVCIGLCPTDALHMDSLTRRISFHDDKCVVCEACIKPCPARAILVQF